jgi:hypothetical protein
VFPLHHFLPVRVPQGNKWDAVERVLTKRRHDLAAFALRLSSLRVDEAFQLRKLRRRLSPGDWKVPRTRRLESLRYGQVIHSTKISHE